MASSEKSWRLASREIGRASCRERGVDLGGRRIIKKKKHPVVISKFLQNAAEVELDAVSDSNEVIICSIIEHIDNAGFFFQAEDGIRDHCVTGVQTCALPI